MRTQYRAGIKQSPMMAAMVSRITVLLSIRRKYYRLNAHYRDPKFRGSRSDRMTWIDFPRDYFRSPHF